MKTEKTERCREGAGCDRRPQFLFFTFHFSFFIFHFLSSVLCLLSSVFCPLSSVLCPETRLACRRDHAYNSAAKACREQGPGRSSPASSLRERDLVYVAPEPGLAARHRGGLPFWVR